jgi:hypothetical protein
LASTTDGGKSGEANSPSVCATDSRRAVVGTGVVGIAHVDVLLTVTEVERGRHFVAHSSFDERGRLVGKPWGEASWLFFVEPLGKARCRFISRFRCACSDDLATRLAFGPALIEPVGFAMDRRMLLGVKERAERRFQPA